MSASRRSERAMRLGELIDTLAALPPAKVVRYDHLPPPRYFASWRGAYAELTLAPGHGSEPTTVASLLWLAREADGGTFEGWKGGDYVMNRDTPVWADDEGDCSCRAIVGVSINDAGAVVLSTADVSDYRGW